MPTRLSPQPGCLFVLSGPSGAGKSTIARGLSALTEGLLLSVSHTTRPRRPGEEAGREYHFVSEDAFRAMAAQDEFLEWAEVHGRLYGTAAAPVSRALESGLDVLLEIDIQGGAQVRARGPRAVGLFVLPPDFHTLRQRLRDRGTDSEAQIARRLAEARREAREFRHYDYCLVNHEVDTTIAQARTIILAERHRTDRMLHKVGAILDGFAAGAD